MSDEILRIIEQRLYNLSIAAKRLKQEVERATRIVHGNPLQAEKMLTEALRRAEEDGL